MNTFRVQVVAVIALWITSLLYGVTYAFHDGGENNCMGCHTIHSSQANPDLTTYDRSSTDPIRLILKGSDPSSTCLQCHAERGAPHAVLSNDGSRFTPGGDFYWLGKTFSWSIEGGHYQSRADRHGHNVVALDYGMYQDGRLDHAPGGTYLAAALGCSSCHDPHGKTMVNGGDMGTTSVSALYDGEPVTEPSAGNYRLLGGQGYVAGGQGSGIIFAFRAPIAVANSFNWTETDSNHPAYGSGMSEWCANCHRNFLNGSTSGLGGKHPAGKGARITAEIANNYNSYVRTGDLSGIQASAYLALVPFEVGTTNASLLDPSSSSGPDPGGDASVMCLTCHRAHASAFEGIGRWDFKTTFMADSHPQVGDGGASGTDAFNSYYGRSMIAEFGKNQRQLCNKCHLKD